LFEAWCFQLICCGQSVAKYRQGANGNRLFQIHKQSFEIHMMDSISLWQNKALPASLRTPERKNLTMLDLRDIFIGCAVLH